MNFPFGTAYFQGLCLREYIYMMGKATSLWCITPGMAIFSIGPLGWDFQPNKF